MKWIRSEEEVDRLLDEILSKGKGRHVTQSVVFNKNNPRQMRLLKMVLMSTESFSGLMKEMISHKFDNVKLPSEMVDVKVEEVVVPIQKESINQVNQDEQLEIVENSFEEVKPVLKKGMDKFV